MEHIVVLTYVHVDNENAMTTHKYVKFFHNTVIL